MICTQDIVIGSLWKTCGKACRNLVKTRRKSCDNAVDRCGKVVNGSPRTSKEELSVDVRSGTRGLQIQLELFVGIDGGHIFLLFERVEASLNIVGQRRGIIQSAGVQPYAVGSV